MRRKSAPRSTHKSQVPPAEARDIVDATEPPPELKGAEVAAWAEITMLPAWQHIERCLQRMRAKVLTNMETMQGRPIEGIYRDMGQAQAFTVILNMRRSALLSLEKSLQQSRKEDELRARAAELAEEFPIIDEETSPLSYADDVQATPENPDRAG